MAKKAIWVVCLILLLALTVIGAWLLGKNETPQPLAIADSAWQMQRPCEPSLELSTKLDIQCLWVNVSTGLASAPIWLSVATVQKRGQLNSLAPLVYLPGGPGTTHNTQGEMLNYWGQWYLEARLSRPLLVFDYRGLGPSRPAPVCEEFKTASIDNLKRNMALMEESASLNAVFERCLGQVADLMAKSGRPGFIASINSSQNAEDIRTAMRRLNYDSWHLLGVSYGARVAIIAGLTQEEVGKLILDSPFSLNFGRTSDTPVLWSRALNKFFDRCDQRSDCRGELSRDEFWRIAATLRNAPLDVESSDWSTNKQRKWMLNDVRLVALVFNMLYFGEVDQSLMNFLASLRRGDMVAIQEDLDLFFNLMIDQNFQEWVYIATACNDQPAETEQAYETRIAQLGPQWRDMFSGLLTYDPCGDKRFSDGSIPTMTKLNKPTLAVVGELDPVTPIEEVSVLANFIREGKLITLPGAGHAEFLSHPCGQRGIVEFLAADSNAPIDGAIEGVIDEITHCFVSDP